MERIEYHNRHGQLVGIAKDGVYRKLVRRKKHLMRMYNGYAMDYDIYEKLLADGCKEVRIKEDDTGDVYSSPFSAWGKGIIFDFDGKQVCLPCKEMTLVTKK